MLLNRSGISNRFVRIPTEMMRFLTNVEDERNIYVHPNPLARWIFWQRLVFADKLLKGLPPAFRVLDFGGGSGAFLPSLRARFSDVSIIDLDLADAKRIAEHYGITDIHFYNQDINSFAEDALFDLIVATDVLEHFSDMEEPYRFFSRYLKEGGMLLVSLPTENALYELGRRIVHKTKPEDHYHSAAEIVKFYEAHGYRKVTSRLVPCLAGLGLPLFFIGLFKKAKLP